MHEISSQEFADLRQLDDAKLQEMLSRLPAERRREVADHLKGWSKETEPQEAERSLHVFVKQAWHVVEPHTTFIDGWHIRLLCDVLERISRGEVETDVLINVPPGTCKSLLCSVFWPCWEWGPRMRADLRWLFGSYSAELSTRDSLRRRRLIKSDWFQSRWSNAFQLVGDQDRKTRYDNDRGGWMFATSVGGGGTGEHPSRVVADDPHKVMEAESEEERKHAIDWWDGTISSRGVIHDCRRVVIMQRLDSSDLSDHMLQFGNVCHVCLPMRYEADHPYPCSLDSRLQDGELLWPEAFDERKTTALEKRLSWRAAGQLQQRPSSREGSMFKREWFKFCDAAPRDARRVRGWDKASTQGAGAFTAGVKIATTEGIYYIEDAVRAQLSPHGRHQLMRATAELDSQHDEATEQCIELEGGSSGKDAGWFEMQLLAGFIVSTEPPRVSKETRARPLASQAEAGNVVLVRGLWNQDFVNELCDFPQGKFKDQVDGASLAFNRLTRPGYGDTSDIVMADLPDEKEGTRERDAELPDDLAEIVAASTERGGRWREDW